MKEEMLTDAWLREFLLGKLDDEQRERIESLFLTDSQAREKILAAEQDLIEDYLEDSLTAADKEIFVSRYGQTPAQQRQLQINKSIKDWALRESGSTRTSFWARLREGLALKPAVVIPIVVTVMIGIVVAAVWLSGRSEQQRRFAIEQELAQLNAPAALRENPPYMTSLQMSPNSVRSVEQETELKKTGDIQLFELSLPWVQRERYSSYRAELLRVGVDDEFIIPNLAADDDGPYRVRLRLPAHLLHRGHYSIRLIGITPDGSPGLTGEYTFAVSE